MCSTCHKVVASCNLTLAIYCHPILLSVKVIQLTFLILPDVYYSQHCKQKRPGLKFQCLVVAFQVHSVISSVQFERKGFYRFYVKEIGSTRYIFLRVDQHYFLLKSLLEIAHSEVKVIVIISQFPLSEDFLKFPLPYLGCSGKISTPLQEDGKSTWVHVKMIPLFFPRYI